MKYIMKELPEVEVIELVENTIDPEGNKVAGRVVYINEYGAKGVKTWDQFFEDYKELEVWTEENFLNLIDEDIEKGFIKPIPRDVMERVNKIKIAAENARRFRGE